ncbi:ferritin-like domain-containing protein [Vineibacter terrae]|uniref:ferritin-like domain-containing protein n=1 Tax=Vineibacter terrae TaxID=2586908 RepID=UPI002E34AF2B|nr:ferritin-like domain-containing protein [Vineibacter terrae]HEX2886059.1 ferritin-like domain-containing protein [Vineibacter terrae]
MTGHPDDAHITHDPAYSVVAPDDFPAMIEVDRYETRSDAFDGIIGQTHDHFWDPFNPAYLDYAQPFDVTREYIMPPERVLELNTAVSDRLDEGQRVRLANNITRFRMSGILHGEQGALSLSASLCDILLDPGAQEYAANQAREEARHVAGFGRYIKVRWGKAYPCAPELGKFLNDIVLSPIVYKKLVGMQIMLEGLAMGAFADTYAYTRDPLLKRLIQLVMTDEAFHHKFGKIWADRTLPKLTPEEHNKVEDWAAHVFESLLFNLTSISQRTYIYEELGLDWQWVRDAVREAYGRDSRRNSMQESTNIFRVLIKTLLKAGIITERTKHVYSPWVDLGELVGEGDSMVGDAIAADGIEYLREINRKRRGVNLKATAA